MTLYEKVLAVAGMFRNSLDQKAGKLDFAPLFNPSTTYPKNRLVVYDNKLYRSTTVHSGAWDESHFALATVEDVLLLKADLDDLAPDYSDSGEYEVDELVVKDGALQICTSAGTGALAAFREATVQDALDAIKDSIPEQISALLTGGAMLYDMAAATISGSGSVVVNIEDRTVNTVAIAPGTTAISLSLPNAVSGKSRDFVIAVTMPANLTLPATVYGGVAVNAQGDGVTPNFTGGKTTTYRFTEIENGKFCITGAVSGGGGGGGGTGDYVDLTNKPRINNVELVGPLTGAQLGLLDGEIVVPIPGVVDEPGDNPQVAEAIATCRLIGEINPRSGVSYTDTVAVYPTGQRSVKTITTLSNESFDAYNEIVAIYGGSACVAVAAGTFVGSSSLKIADLPYVETVGTNSLVGGALMRCGNLEVVRLPSATYLAAFSLGENPKLKELVLSSAVTVANSLLYGCGNLERIDLPALQSVGGGIFEECAKLQEVNFGNSISAVPTIPDTLDNMSSVPASCTIVVPDDLYDEWIAATGWKRLYDNGRKFVRYSDWQLARKYELNASGPYAITNITASDGSPYLPSSFLPVAYTYSGHNYSRTEADQLVVTSEGVGFTKVLHDVEADIDIALFDQYGVYDSPMTGVSALSFGGESASSSVKLSATPASANMQDHAINHVTIPEGTVANELSLVPPERIEGRSRDFYVILDEAAGGIVKSASVVGADTVDAYSKQSQLKIAPGKSITYHMVETGVAEGYCLPDSCFPVKYTGPYSSPALHVLSSNSDIRIAPDSDETTWFLYDNTPSAMREPVCGFSADTLKYEGEGSPDTVSLTFRRDGEDVVPESGVWPSLVEGTRPRFLISGMGGGASIESVTWAELKAMRDAGELTPGASYRITDYVATVNSNFHNQGWISANKPFDVIVVADDEDALNETARAVRHGDDVYFSTCNLEAWKLQYCLDNDTARFAWADVANGRGVIYRMVDEFKNDIPFDFKGLQYTGEYLFATYEGGDATIPTAGSQLVVRGNKMLPSTSTTSGTGAFTLSSFRIYFPANSAAQCIDNVFGANSHVHASGSFCRNTVGSGSLVNFGSNNTDNTIGTGCTNVTLGNSCSRNVFGAGCTYITLGAYNTDNEIGESCDHITFGNSCACNILGPYCRNNTFGGTCASNTLQSSCSNNTFTAAQTNTLGAGCSGNSITGSGNSIGAGSLNRTYGGTCKMFGPKWEFVSAPTKLTVQPLNGYLASYTGSPMGEFNMRGFVFKANYLGMKAGDCLTKLTLRIRSGNIQWDADNMRAVVLYVPSASSTTGTIVGISQSFSKNTTAYGSVPITFASQEVRLKADTLYEFTFRSVAASASYSIGNTINRTTDAIRFPTRVMNMEAYSGNVSGAGYDDFCVRDNDSVFIKKFAPFFVAEFESATGKGYRPCGQAAVYVGSGTPDTVQLQSGVFGLLDARFYNSQMSLNILMPALEEGGGADAMLRIVTGASVPTLQWGNSSQTIIGTAQDMSLTPNAQNIFSFTYAGSRLVSGDKPTWLVGKTIAS